jgi:hypothetical protein
MGILGDTYTQPGEPPHTSFPSDSVLGRMARGGYKPTDADLAELHRLAQSGNRAERRAAARHLRKQGIAAPTPAPKAPLVIPVVTQSAKHVESAAPPKAQARKETQAKKEPPTQAEPVKQGPLSKAPLEKEAVKEAAARKPSRPRTPGKKAAAKKAAPRKGRPAKAATKKTAVKKPAVKKPAVKKTPVRKAAKTAPARASRRK